MRLSLVALSLLFGNLIIGAPADDEVLELHGMPDLKFGLFSGYVPINGTQKQLHYIATLSEKDPSSDPVIIWFNGGPGCSSMLGWAQEHGPYVMEDGTNEFIKNPYPWNKEASIIYLESPAGVGFSICGKQDECSFTDDSSADDNLIAVLNLMIMKFPELQDNDLYLSGESYAGIYVPYLAQRIHKFITDAKHKGSKDYIPNFKGFMIGNGVTDWRFDTTPALFEMSQMHGIIPLEQYTFMKQNCTDTDGNFNENLSQKCYGAASRFYDLLESINIYDVYGKCYKEGDSKFQLEQTSQGKLRFENGFSKVSSYFSANQYTPFLNQRRDEFLRKAAPLGSQRPAKLGLIPPCVYAQPIQRYLRNESIRFALNIPTDAPEWDLCSNIMYERSDKGSLEIYKELKSKYRMLIFSGDTDGAVPMFGTQRWIQELNWEVDEPWHPYYVNGQLGGYVETRDENNFVFASIHGAGHMAAQWKRAETYHVVMNFLKDKRI